MTGDSHYFDAGQVVPCGRDRLAGHQAAGPAREAGRVRGGRHPVLLAGRAEPGARVRVRAGRRRRRTGWSPTRTRAGAGAAVRDPAADRGHHSVTEPLWEDERPRLAAMGPVKVRVPAKINLHLGVGPLRRGRVPRGGHDLPRDRAVRRDHRAAGGLARADHGRRGRRRAGPRRDQPGHPGGPGARRARPAGSRTPGCTCASRSRSPAGLAGGSADAAATLVACDALWGTGLSREDLAGVAAGLGSDVPFLVLGGTALGTGRGETVSPVLAPGHAWHWVVAIADGGLSTPEVYRELDRLRDGGPARRRRSARPTRSWPRCASATPRCWPSPSATTCEAAAMSLRPALRADPRRRRRRRRPGRVWSPAPARPASSCAGTPPTPRRSRRPRRAGSAGRPRRARPVPAPA